MSNPRDWGIGVRNITDETYREILTFAGIALPPTAEPQPAGNRELRLATDLLKVRKHDQQFPASPLIASPRRSRRAAATGRAAEELVFRHLGNQFQKVRWLSRDAELPGYDFCYDDGGFTHGVEVKGTVGSVFPAVDLTINEWRAAEQMRHRFWLYLVAKCNEPQPVLQFIQDPFGLLVHGKAIISPVVVRLALHTSL